MIFKDLKIGRPIFFYQGMNGLPEDYSLFIESIKDVFEGEESVNIIWPRYRTSI